MLEVAYNVTAHFRLALQLNTWKQIIDKSSKFKSNTYVICHIPFCKNVTVTLQVLSG